MIKLTIESSVLIWARETRFGNQKDIAAKKLGLTVDQLNSWETSNPEITISQLKKISKVYKRHVSVLLLPKRPKSQEPPKFRKLINPGESALDQKTFLAIRQAQEIQNNSIFLLQEQKNSFILQIKKLGLGLDILVQKISNTLGISTETRFKSKSSHEQLVKWKNILQGQGIIILEHPFPLADSRAFTLYSEISPLIVLNSKDTNNAKIFSLFHELGHLILGQTDLDIKLDLSIDKKNADEFFCNQFAAQMLVPFDLLKDYIGSRPVDEALVIDSAIRFKVSTAVIWRVLFDQSLISYSKFTQMKKELSNFISLVAADKQPN